MATRIVAMTARTPVSAWPATVRHRVFHGQIVIWSLSPRVFSLRFSTCTLSSPSTSRKVILYSKPGCCLCDGLKEKLLAAFSLSGPNSLHDVELQMRYITTNPKWEKAYKYEIPVLAIVCSNGTEETLPGLSPRIGIELIQKKIAAALSL